MEMNYCSYFMALQEAKWIFNRGLARIVITRDDGREADVSGNEVIPCYAYQLQLEHLCSDK